jgi:transcription factor SPN1
MSDANSPAAAAAQDDEQREEQGDYNLAAAGDSDKDSDALSEIDEDQFDDYDPSAARIEEKPVEIDEDAARTLKAGKRKGQAVKKPKEGRREKKKRTLDDDDGADGEILDGKRSRKGAGASERKQPSPSPEINEEDLTPEERRKRAIERAARKDPKKPAGRRKKKDEVVGVFNGRGGSSPFGC